MPGKLTVPSAASPHSEAPANNLTLFKRSTHSHDQINSLRPSKLSSLLQLITDSACFRISLDMNHPENVETESIASTNSDIEATENDYQPTVVAATFHYFLNLPAEIRMQIYDGIASTAHLKPGGLDLFKTSKMIRNEGTAASARHCGFDVWFGYWGNFSTAHPPIPTLGSKATRLIQNVFLHIYLKGVEWGHKSTPRLFDCKLTEYFGGSEVMRESCSITLYYGSKGYVSKDCASTLYQNNQRIVSTEDNRIMSIRNIGKVDLYAFRINAALEPTLGPATLGKLDYELVFRPSGWKPERCASINIWTWREESSRRTYVWV